MQALVFIFFFFFSLSKENDLGIEIVIARFNEDLVWIKDDPFKKYPITCYNSSPDQNFQKNKNMKIEEIKNIGKEAYVYLYHIVKNYYNLSEITIFLPGSSNSYHKRELARKQVIYAEKSNNTVFFGVVFKNVKENLFNFTLDSYCSTSKENSLKNPNCNLNISKIRPFGKWYERHFKNISIKHVNYLGVLGIHRRHILQHTKEYYKNLLNEFKNPNDEVAHYFERVWEAIFYPIDDGLHIKIRFDKHNKACI